MPGIQLLFRECSEHGSEKKTDRGPTSQRLQNAIGTDTDFDIAGGAAPGGTETHDAALLGFFGLRGGEPND